MKKYLINLKKYEKKIQKIKDIILTNTIIIGQSPMKSPESILELEENRPDIFLRRLSEAGADECTKDAFGNPHAIIKGSLSTTPPIMITAHLDTLYDNNVTNLESSYYISNNEIYGPGIMDNSLGVGVLMSLPNILNELDLHFHSDLILVGLIESLKEKNLKSIRKILSIWNSPIRGAICVEGGEKGRLDYFSNGMIRAEIIIEIPMKIAWWNNRNGINAILLMNEVMNEILKIELPQRPYTRIIFGKINSGHKHGEIPLSAKLGLEIQGESDEMVKKTLKEMENVCMAISHKKGGKITLKTISDVKVANLGYHHPLVNAAANVMKHLDIEPLFGDSESELSVFLSHNIPTITLGIAHGENYHSMNEKAFIDSIFGGITQLIGIINAIDQGVCDE